MPLAKSNMEPVRPRNTRLQQIWNGWLFALRSKWTKHKIAVVDSRSQVTSAMYAID